MKKMYFGLAAAAFGAMLTFSGGAQAAPAAAPMAVTAGDIGVSEAQYRRRRTIIRRGGPRCRMVVTRTRTARGMVVRRVRRCR